MPRGNDKDEALHELADKFGRGVGNAEQLIEAQLASRSERLRQAELQRLNVKETEKLREQGFSKLKGPNGERVVSATVRGEIDPITTIVYEDERGAFQIAALDEKNKVAHDEPPEAPVNGPSKEEQKLAEAQAAANKA